MKKYLPLFVSFAVIILAACEMPAGDGGTSSSSSSSSVSLISSPSSDSSVSSSEASTSETSSSANSTSKRVIEMSVSDWAFAPAAITAKKGEVLEIRLTGVTGAHGFAIPELGINEKINPGETKVITIPTDQVGTFRFFCSVPCGPGHKEMDGTITISE